MVCISESLWDGYLGMRGKDAVLVRDVHSHTSSLCPEAQSSYHERQVSWGGLRTQVTDVDNTESVIFKIFINIWKTPFCLMKTKLPIDLFQTPHRKHTCVHPNFWPQTQKFGLHSCCIYGNKPKTNHMAQFTWKFAMNGCRTMKSKG